MTRFPTSRLRAGLRVGAQYFERCDLADGRPPPAGLCDDLAALAGHGFDPASVAPEIRAFYERTASYQMTGRADWGGARWRPRAWAWLGRRVGQFQVPAESHYEAIGNRLLWLREGMDGRGPVKGWVRTRADGSAFVIAAYTLHSRDGDVYDNVALPVPGGNVASVLRWENLAGGGVRVTSRQRRPGGDEGFYFVRGRLCVRLPVAEDVRVWLLRPGDPGAPIRARYEVFVLGRRFAAMDYWIRCAPGERPTAG